MLRNCSLRACAIALFVLVLAAPAGLAKPVILDSEQTAARRCLAFDAPIEQLVTACRAALDQGQRTDTERAALLSLLGDALDLMGEAELAARRYHEAAAADPLNVDPLNGLGWLAWQADQEAEAAEWFAKSVEIHPTAQGIGGLGSALWRSGQVDGDEALGMIDAALAIDPDYVWALRERGWVFLEQDQPDMAAGSFEAALELDAYDQYAAYGLSRARAAEGAYLEALDAINLAIDGDETSGWFYSHRSFVLRQLRRAAQAIPDAERAIEIMPEQSEGYVQKAAAQNDLGNRARALATYQAGVDAGAADDFLLYWYADLLSDDGQLDKALEIIDRAIALSPKDPDHHVMRAYITMEQGAYERALEAADRALSFDPDLGFPHYYAAVALVNTGAVDEGVARFDQGMAAGLGDEMVGYFAADLIAAGKFITAVRLRARY